jgi:hypothetical protein
MNLKGQSVWIHLSDEGRRLLRQAGWEAEDTPPVPFEVQEDSEAGLWVKLPAAGRQYAVLIRWEHIVTALAELGEVKTEDLVN